MWTDMQGGPREDARWEGSRKRSVPWRTISRWSIPWRGVPRRAISLRKPVALTGHTEACTIEIYSEVHNGGTTALDSDALSRCRWMNDVLHTRHQRRA